jgi:hypothetical protein
MRDFRFLVVAIPSLLATSSSADAWTSAEWIWSPADGPANTWMCFRHTVTLESVPASVPTTIATDSKYWLWINGTLAVFEGGLKRGPNPTDTWYDEIDLAPWLVPGTNTIAALVWHFGDHGHSHLDSGRGGLLFEADVGGPAVVSSSAWRHTVHPAYGVTAAPWPNWTLSEANVHFDATRDSIAGWTVPGFDDSGWAFAVEKGPAGVSPWNDLEKRPIPPWRDSGLRDYENAASFPAFGDGSTITARLPANLHVTPYLHVIAPAGSLVVDVRTDHYNGGGPENLRSEYLTKSGEQEFESLAWMNGHEVRYTIPAGVEILALKYRETGYDCDFSGSFTCDAPFFDDLWSKAQRTLYVCMRDNFMDCPDRERAQYWGDVVTAQEMCAYAMDPSSHALTRKAIRDLVNWQRSDSTLYAPVPSGNWTAELPIQMLASVGWYGFWTYYLNTGDAETIQHAYPHVRDYLALWQIGPDGLVIHRPGDWDWPDWGVHADVSVLENAWYALALRAAAGMADVSGDPASAAAYDSLGASLHGSFNDELWNGTAYNSPGHASPPDDRANAMAVLAGMADEAKWPQIRTVLTNQQYASPWMEKFVLEALFVMGFPDDALARMVDRYTEMVEAPPSTLWEKWIPGAWNSQNHAWSGGPLTVLSRYAAGVAPTSQGWTTYAVLPQEGSLARIDVVVPTVQGDVVVDIDRDAGSYALGLVSPGGTTATVGIPKSSAPALITVNGTPIWDGSYLGGVSGVSDAGEDARWILFGVEPGVWSFLATSTAVGVPGTRIEAGTRLVGVEPNPALGRCVVRFATAASGPVELRIHDAAGRRVRRLVDRSLPPGLHAAEWDGRDSTGRAVASGVYFVELRAGARRVTGSVVWLR